VDIIGNSMRTPNEAILECAADLVGDVLSVHLSQQAGSNASWSLTIYVQIAQGYFQLGQTLVIDSPASGDPPARTVAFAGCPGALGWKVLATCPTNGEIADLVIQSSRNMGTAIFGVVENSFAGGT
jgi:hypothetical protein